MKSNIKIGIKVIRLNKYLKYIVLFLGIIALFLGAGIFAINRYYNTTSFEEFEAVFQEEQLEEIEETETEEERAQRELDERYGRTRRVNILLAGIDGARTDTLMVLSYDQEDNMLDIISIPRDTYIDLYGYNDPARRKINSVFGYPQGRGGIRGTAEAVSKILGVTIHNYAVIDYKGVKEIVDAIGGVEVNIPFRMIYDDPFDTPPLRIRFEKGVQTLNGEDAVKYLRWRKNNSGAMGDEGDLGRINRQQEFVILAMKKAMNPIILPNVITTGLNNTRTSLTLSEALYYGTKALNMKDTDINAYSLPGEDRMENGAWYFFHDREQTRSFMRNLYRGIRPLEDERD